MIYLSKGITGFECNANELGHAVLLIGAGETKEGKKFWRLKNSWGEDWGDAGYLLLERIEGSSPQPCGIGILPTYPIMS